MQYHPPKLQFLDSRKALWNQRLVIFTAEIGIEKQISQLASAEKVESRRLLDFFPNIFSNCVFTHV